MVEISPFLDARHRNHNNNKMDPVDVVISALKDRGISCKRDEIRAALDVKLSSSNNAKWVEEHLTPDTLLSQEELRLYALSSIFKLSQYGILIFETL